MIVPAPRGELNAAPPRGAGHEEGRIVFEGNPAAQVAPASPTPRAE